jgi:predicted outer membrane repeat protein
MLACIAADLAAACTTTATTTVCVHVQCTFTSNVAHRNGGAVATERETTLEVVDCVFNGNKATVDSVSADTGDGGTTNNLELYSQRLQSQSYLPCTSARHTVHTASCCTM